MLEQLAVAIKEVAAVEPSALTDSELSERLVELSTLACQLEAVRTEMVGVWEARKVWASDGSGARSGAAWLAAHTREPKHDCGSMVWLARRLRHMPQIAAAFAAGELSAAHVRKLAGVHNPRTWRLFERDQHLFLEWAGRLLFSEFSRAVDYWWLHADPDGADERDMERRDRRRVSLDDTIDGMFVGSIVLDPVSGSIVWDELHRLEAELFAADWSEARQRLGSDPQPFELARTAEQRQADALVEMARRSRSLPDGAKTAKPLFTVLLGADTFRRVLELGGGQVVAPEALREWLADADLERVLFDGTPERVISVSRKRNFTGALRRLIEVRDRVCFHPTCDEAAASCQVDHIQPWIQGGMTAQWNGRLACGFHNRSRPNSKRPPPPDDEDDGDGDDPAIDDDA